MTTSQKTCLYPHEIREIPAALLAEGITDGHVRIIHSRLMQVVERNCTDCGEVLPAIVCTHIRPQWSTFPRCSRHAF